jgi:hypothetical protein
VRAGERETSAGMIERGAGPRGRVVAALTGLRKLRLHVIGIGSALVILHVAGHAGGSGDVVVAVYVALRTR